MCFVSCVRTCSLLDMATGMEFHIQLVDFSVFEVITLHLEH